MSVLSEWDIVKELGKGIFIYPFKGINNSLSGCCLKLTASEYVYIVESSQYTPVNYYTEKVNYYTEKQDNQTIKQAKNIVVKDEKEGAYFVIPPSKTALVWTNESVVMNGKYCGSIHSKVSIVAKGIGHIGTRVNPYWGGVLSIALHNLSNEYIRVFCDETIAYLRFYKLNSSSSESHVDADSIRSAKAKLGNAFPQDCPVPPELERWLTSSDAKWRDGDKQAFFDVLEKDRIDKKEELTEYQKAKRDWWRRCKFIAFFLPRNKKVPWLSIVRYYITPVITFIFGWISSQNWDIIWESLMQLVGK